jgi:hypothetical protein
MFQSRVTTSPRRRRSRDDRAAARDKFGRFHVTSTVMARIWPEPRLDDHPDVYEHKQQQCNEVKKWIVRADW